MALAVSSLQGRVNKLAASHVGCLVHGCFNGSIPKPNLVPMETWRDAGPQIGAELEFEVSALDSDNVGVLLIRGQLDRTRQVLQKKIQNVSSLFPLGLWLTFYLPCLLQGAGAAGHERERSLCHQCPPGGSN